MTSASETQVQSKASMWRPYMGSGGIVFPSMILRPSLLSENIKIRGIAEEIMGIHPHIGVGVVCNRQKFLGSRQMWETFEVGCPLYQSLSISCRKSKRHVPICGQQTGSLWHLSWLFMLDWNPTMVSPQGVFRTCNSKFVHHDKFINTAFKSKSLLVSGVVHILLLQELEWLCEPI